MAVVARKLESKAGRILPKAHRSIKRIGYYAARLDCFLVMNGFKPGVTADYLIKD